MKIARNELLLMTVPTSAIPPNQDQDGYALRIAVEHHISIKQQYGRVTAKGKFSATVSFRDCGGDRCAATRLAIFTAAGIASEHAT